MTILFLCQITFIVFNCDFNNLTIMHKIDDNKHDFGLQVENVEIRSFISCMCDVITSSTWFNNDNVHIS